MSLLLLSFLLLLLVGIGLLMATPRIRERFENPPAAGVATVKASPVMAALMTAQPQPQSQPPPQADPLAREKDVVAAAAAVPSTSCPACPACPTCPSCPKCPTCADMSQYIRMDEVPCWNCTLP